ncbi:MAG: hypothetical protein H0W78_13995 [Planctomycetes bacterium]|jgi:hypothetical protein|nr:hypothetical protein [Planctomycetota bacterium]
MSPEVITALVRLVANGRKFRVADAVVIEHLIEMGVPQAHAAELLAEIAQGLQHGSDVAVAGTGEPPPCPPASPLYLAGFTEGQRAVLADVQTRQSSRRTMLAIAVLIVLGVLIYVVVAR